MFLTLLGGIAPARSVHSRATAADPSAGVPDLRPLPAGSTQPGRFGAESSAVALAVAVSGVVLEPATAGEPPAACPADRLVVSWDDPGPGYRIGAVVTPVGPVPDDTTTRVNGAVLCHDSHYAYMGFEASWDGSAWTVNAVPSPVEDDGDPAAAGPETAAAATRAGGPVGASASGVDPSARKAGASGVHSAGSWGPGIEALASYDPQRTCDATAKPGTLALRDFLLARYPGSRNLGIGTACDGTVSEHHEGRAFDFGVRVNVPSEAAQAKAFIDWLFATDQYGNRYAMARRLGIMYLIWDHHIWGAYRADEGWRPYSGVSPHTDHVHISLTWAGALGRTSFWSGQPTDLGPVTLAAATPSSSTSSAGSSTARRTAASSTSTPPTTTRPSTTSFVRPPRSTTTSTVRPPRSTTTSSLVAPTWTRPPRSTTTTVPRSTTTTSTTRPPRTTTTTSTTVRTTSTTSSTSSTSSSGTSRTSPRWPRR